MKSTTDGVTTIKTSDNSDGYDCSGASNKIVLVIPEDEGLKEKIEEIIATAQTNGVTIEVVPSFGNGASATVVKEEGKEE